MKGSIRMMAAAGMLLAAAAGFAAAKPRVEVAFVLDSTGSMGGLIEGAKQKIWSIANSIIAQKPAPDVRIGLVTYRDRGDAYVTERFDLTADIDEVFRTLLSFAADGGGDDPESVNQALHEAVTGLSWSSDVGVLKIIFLVGDYPPHMDYAADVKYPVTCREAVRRGVIIDTVQCGEVPETTAVWKEIARLSEGSFVALAQSGNMRVVATPYDEEIARTSAAIGATIVTYGAREVQEEARSKVSRAEAAPAALAADRAAYNLATGGRAIQGAGDLVSDTAEGSVNLSMLPKDELPPEMWNMTPSERTAYLAAMRAKREKLNAALGDLNRARADYLAKEQARAAEGSADSFDLQVTRIISAQAARVR